MSRSAVATAKPLNDAAFYRVNAPWVQEVADSLAQRISLHRDALGLTRLVTAGWPCCGRLIATFEPRRRRAEAAEAAVTA